MSNKKIPTREQLLKVIEELEKNPNSKQGILGDIGITALGAVGAGAAVAAAGVTTSIPIITAVTGIGLVVAAPLSLVAGAALAGGAVAYGVSRLIKGGGHEEGVNTILLDKYRTQLREIQAKEKASSINEKDKNQFTIFLKEPLQRGLISNEDAYRLIMAVEQGQMSLSEAYQLVGNVIK